MTPLLPYPKPDGLTRPVTIPRENVVSIRDTPVIPEGTEHHQLEGADDTDAEAERTNGEKRYSYEHQTSPPRAPLASNSLERLRVSLLQRSKRWGLRWKARPGMGVYTATK